MFFGAVDTPLDDEWSLGVPMAAVAAPDTTEIGYEKELFMLHLGVNVRGE